MQKTLAVLVAFTLPTAALANDNPGFYVQGDLGHSSMTIKSTDENFFNDKSKGFSPRLSVGYDFGNARLAVDYTHYKTFNSQKPEGGTIAKDQMKFRSVGVSAIYDFNLNSSVKPYVGARLGLNHLSHDSDDVQTADGRIDHLESLHKTKTGLGALAGVSYNVTQNIALDTGYRYNYWGKFDGVKIRSHELSAGVRVKF